MQSLILFKKVKMSGYRIKFLSKKRLHVDFVYLA